MISDEIQQSVREAVNAVEDPEVPITLADLGVLRGIDVTEEGVQVTLRPTRLGCPARGEMATRVSSAVRRAAPGTHVDIVWQLKEWDRDDVTSRGRYELAQSGYGNPTSTTVRCPYCTSGDVRGVGAFGGAVCKVPYTCSACGSTFDLLRGSAALGAAAAGTVERA
jgi:ring-1,2-phenylacetyl-CoA epoxidase subunit PaaD